MATLRSRNVDNGTSGKAAEAGEHGSSEGDGGDEKLKSTSSIAPIGCRPHGEAPPAPSSASSSNKPMMLSWNGGFVALAFFALGLSTSWIQERWLEDPHWWARPSRDAARSGSRQPNQGVSRSNGDVSRPSSSSSSSSLPPGQHHPCHPKDGVLDQFLHDRPEPGLHLVCVRDDRVTFYRGAVHDDYATVRVLGGSGPDEVADGEARSLSVHLFEEILDLKDDTKEEAQDRFLAWAVFSTEGERLFDASSFEAHVLRDHGLVLVVEAGVWRWPGVRVGFQRRVDLPHANLSFTLETLSLSPLVLSTTGFLSESECMEIQHVAEPLVRYSEVTLMDKDAGRPSTDFRTSSSVFVTKGSPVFAELNDRTASFLRIPHTHQEHLQVLRYYPGEKYDQHDDYFDPRMYQNDAATLALTKHGKRNRFATFFWYLSNVTTGGETSFPKVEGRVPRTLLDCSGTGALLVKPQRGKAVLFYSMRADGRLDPRSTHAACPVGPGSVKWASNKWVWNRPMNYVR